jgi:hypothetical protein
MLGKIFSGIQKVLSLTIEHVPPRRPLYYGGPLRSAPKARKLSQKRNTGGAMAEGNAGTALRYAAAYTAAKSARSRLNCCGFSR